MVKRSREEPPLITERDGLRFVSPYMNKFSCFAKGRWFGRDVLEVCATEFAAYPRDHYIKAAETGELKVTSRAGGSEYAGDGRILKENDLVTHCALVKENPVPAKPIEIIFEDDKILAVNKPNGWPVHPCGNYRYNSIIEALKIQHNLLHLAPMHRIDRLTSGMLLLAKTTEAARAGQSLGTGDGSSVKVYVARVKGKFEKDIIVKEPLACLDAKYGKWGIDPEGKASVTEFEVLMTGEEESLVICRPLTGRTHQIRVHLQHLGHPIVNDECYGGVYDAKHPFAFPRIPGNKDQDFFVHSSGSPVHCSGIFLHAWKYVIPDMIDAQTPLPDWASVSSLSF